mmetsp:Transcript_43675/g.87421  ORF Transcript_43675/g.87421 Transcript_43675/m.87421 type:complete len:96 (-) Transcript_43675:259-546(-)|eukprot:CAMPEP_0174727560 /NCGR_PEP_ID=MMETSP1094-20130205/50034_1 /TAXON_ID=156173 /ORGANISM="Chrysochromulina brevifilum, Strain UTEX LB 985" /LENGTH=95 /DNA_ID=CAMNT_0015929329 /DNA_START=48 /DNA_END=335 /DNA_ORIENTATION=-
MSAQHSWTELLVGTSPLALVAVGLFGLGIISLPVLLIVQQIQSLCQGEEPKVYEQSLEESPSWMASDGDSFVQKNSLVGNPSTKNQKGSALELVG